MIKEMRLNLNATSAILYIPNRFKKEAVKNSSKVKYRDFAEVILSTQQEISETINTNQ